MIKGRVPWRQCLRHTLTLRLHAHCVSLRAGSSLRRCLRRLTQTIVLLGRGPHCLSLYQELTMWMLARAPPGVCFRHCVYIFFVPHLVRSHPWTLSHAQSIWQRLWTTHVRWWCRTWAWVKVQDQGKHTFGDIWGHVYYKHVKIND